MLEYSAELIKHYENPSNIGSLDENDIHVGTGMIGSPACGDVMRLQIWVEKDVIKEVKFKTFGCGSAIASSSLATEYIKNKTLKQAMQVKNIDIVKQLDLPPVKIHCSILAEEAIQAAIKNYLEKHHRSLEEVL